MFLSAAVLVAAYALGSIPVAFLTGRFTKQIDLRETGSGNAGASNIFQSVSKTLVVPVGLAQIAQGALAVLMARWTERPDGVQAACAAAAMLANCWNPWLRFSGGRGIGVAIGALAVLSPIALIAFICIGVAGVVLRLIPQAVALALLLTPFMALAGGDGWPFAIGCAALAVIALLKRLTGNGAPAADAPRPDVWWNRLMYDRDIRDRDAWVRRNLQER
jgi:glycerol-3-phosphate acyltransferase PlsY